VEGRVVMYFPGLLVGRLLGCSFVRFVFVAFVGVVGVSEEEPCVHEESDGVEGGVNYPELKLFLEPNFLESRLIIIF
jgi:hypothetical protein